MLTKTTSFWIQVAVAVILAVAITMTIVEVAPTGVLDWASAAAGSTSETITSQDDAPEQAVRTCWLVCW